MPPKLSCSAAIICASLLPTASYQQPPTILGGRRISADARSRVSMTPDVGRKVDTRLSWKYKGPDADRPGAVRVVVRMVVEKATGYAAA
jgi:hypothetical protein